MLTAKGFDEQFDKNRYKFANGEAAFNHMNEDYRKAFGSVRYSSYESYKVARSVRQSKG